MTHGPTTQPIAIVTGANRGVGRASVEGLVSAGWYVVMMCRDAHAAQGVAAEIDEKAGRAATVVIEVDLSSQRSVRAAVKTFLHGHDRLDALVNNAATVSQRRVITEDGIEVQFAVNHLAPFLMTHLLLDTLKASAPSRVVTLASNAHYRTDVVFPDNRARYSHLQTYRQTKLANILFTRELARRLAGTGVTANAVNPGLVATGLLANLSKLPTFLGWVWRPLALDARSGAETTLHVVTSPDLANTTGKYLHREQILDVNPVARDDALALRLWEESERLTDVGSSAGGRS